MVAYALKVVDDILSTYPEVIMSSESGNWTGTKEEEIQSLKKNKTWKLANYQKVRRQLGANGYLQRKKNFLIKKIFATRQDWLLKALLGGKKLIVMRYFLQLLNITPFGFYWPW